MARVSRRTFLARSAAASTAFGLFTIAGTKASGRVLGANDTIRVGVAGIRGRGQSHIDAFASQLKNENVQVTYLIDPDTRLFDSRKSKVTHFLLRARLAHHSEVPLRISRQPRIGSPPSGGSTLITSAP